MDLGRRHSSLTTEIRISLLTLLVISSSAAEPRRVIDACESPDDCENGARMANQNDCRLYYECGYVQRNAPLQWINKTCGFDQNYDYRRERCVSIDDPNVTCHNECPGKVDLNLSKQPNYDELFEGSKLQFVCCFLYTTNDSPVKVQKFQWSIDGQKITNHGKQITIMTDKDYDENKSLCSTLTFDPITLSDAGCIQCAVNYMSDGRQVIMKDLYVRPSPRPSVSIYPLVLDIFPSERFILRCTLSSAHADKFIWFENGNVIDPLTGDVNISYPTANTSLLQKSIRSQRDPIIFSCMAQTKFVNTSLQNAVITVINSDDKYCNTDYDNKRSIVWNRTKVGNENVQPCPENATGVCSRKCSLNRSGMAVWSQPNYNGCVHKKFKDILYKIGRLENGVGLDNQTVAAEIASELSASTKPAGLSPGNLNASLQAIDQLGNLRKKSIPNNDEITSVVQSISNVLQPNNSEAWQQLQAVNRTVTAVLMSSADVYGRSLSITMNKADQKAVNADYMVLEAMSLEKSNLPSKVTFPYQSAWNEQRIDMISISTNTIEAASPEIGQNLKIWSSYYRNIDEYLPGKNATSFINSRVLSLTIDGVPIEEKLKQPVIVTLQHNKQEEIEDIRRTCVFWKFSDDDGGKWDSTGCSVTSTNSTHTICSCDHLTNFAILMSRNPSNDPVLSIVSTVGCSISVAALILTVIIYVATWKQMKSDQAAVLLNLCFALIIANIVFLAGADKVVPEDGCKAVAVLLHYFFLAAFFLMLAEGVELLLYIIFVFHVRRKIEMALLIVAAWVLALIIVVISLAATKTIGYGNSQSCWLSVESGLIWAFIAPALCIIAANFVILFIVLRRISQARFSAAKDEKKNRIRATIWNISVICPVLGIAWVFGVLSVSLESVVFQYLFAIANSLQGVLIFIFHALFHNKKISEKISYLHSNCAHSRRKPNFGGTQTAAPQGELPKKISMKGIVPKLVEYYEGLENETSSSDVRKHEEHVTSSTNLSSTTDQTNTSSYDTSTTAEVYNINASPRVRVQGDKIIFVEHGPTDDEMMKC